MEPRATHRLEELVQFMEEAKEQTMLELQGTLNSSLQSSVNSVINLGFQQYPVLKPTLAARLAWWQVLLHTIEGKQKKSTMPTLESLHRKWFS